MELHEYKKQIRKEQLYYKSLKFVKIDQNLIEEYWKKGFSPIDALNDMLTL